MKTYNVIVEPEAKKQMRRHLSNNIHNLLVQPFAGGVGAEM